MLKLYDDDLIVFFIDHLDKRSSWDQMSIFVL